MNSVIVCFRVDKFYYSNWIVIINVRTHSNGEQELADGDGAGTVAVEMLEQQLGQLGRRLHATFFDSVEIFKQSIAFNIYLYLCTQAFQIDITFVV